MSAEYPARFHGHPHPYGPATSPGPVDDPSRAPTPPPGHFVPPPGRAPPPYASRWRRAAASPPDTLLMFVPLTVLAAIGELTDQGWLFPVSGAAFIAVGLWTVHDQGRTGRSWGRRRLGIGVLRERDGLPTGFGMGFARAIAHYVLDGLCFVGHLLPLWHRKRQTIADIVCSTIVIRVR